MATGQIYMLLALLSFSMLGVLHKVADVKRSRPSAINALLASSSLLFVFAVRRVRDRQRAGGAGARGRSWRIPFGVSGVDRDSGVPGGREARQHRHELAGDQPLGRDPDGGVDPDLRRARGHAARRWPSR